MTGEQPTACSEQRRRAKKAHRCCECGREIAAGEVYEYVSGIWDARPASFKTCLMCAEVSDLACQCADDDWLPAFGLLAQWLIDFASEHALNISGDTRAEVIASAKPVLTEWAKS